MQTPQERRYQRLTEADPTPFTERIIRKSAAVTKHPGQHAYGFNLGLARHWTRPQLILMAGRYRLTIPTYISG